MGAHEPARDFEYGAQDIVDQELLEQELQAPDVDEKRAARAKKLQRHEVIVSPTETIPLTARKVYEARLPIDDWRAMRAWLTTFYPFQLKWLLETRRRVAAVKARQIGWSHTTAANAVIWGAFHGELTTIISKGHLESKEVLEKAKLHARVLRMLGATLAEPVKSTSEEIVFASGGRILALPSSGGRGFTGNVILDEFAYHMHREKVWDAAAAATQLGTFRLRVISTPNGSGDEFHELIENIKTQEAMRRMWGLHEITIAQAVAQLYPVSLEECMALAKGDPRLFAQLYECAFLDGQLQYIPTEDVYGCTAAKIPRFLPKDGGYGFFGGLDIGESHDRTVLIVVFMDRTGKRWLQWQRSCKRTDFKALEDMVAEAFRTFGLRRLCLDATGLGTFEGQRLKAKYGEMVVEAVKFTEASKEELATHLYTAFTKKLVAIPAAQGVVLDIAGNHALGAPTQPGKTTAQEIIEDVCKIRRVITQSGNVRYDAPRTAAGHADNAWALGLALHACSLPVPRLNAFAGLPDMS